MEKKLYSILISVAGFLSSQAAMASDMPIFRSTSSVPLIVYSVGQAEIVDDYFFPNDPLRSVAFVRLTGTYESSCTSVELSAHMNQSMGSSKNELLTNLSIVDVSAAGESVGVEPKICTQLSVPKTFDLKLNFQPKFWDTLPGERQWKVKIKYGRTGKENEYTFVVKLNSNTGFSLAQ